MQVSCSICRYSEKHDYLSTYYCRNKKCYQSRCFDRFETFNCPYGELKDELKIKSNSSTKETVYKIFEVTYNDGNWHTGDLPHVFYIATSEEEVISNCKEYQKFLEYQKQRGGNIWIKETKGLEPKFYFENLKDFNIEVTVKRKEN